jgi:hypothetical protein
MRGRARGRWAAWAGRGRSVGAWEREKGSRLGPDLAQPRGDSLFHISFYLTPFSFKQKFI